MEDENSRRIAEVLVGKSGKRNLLLLGVCAMDALRSFTERVKNGGENVLPSELSGLSVICIGNEISEFVNGGGSVEKMGLKLKEVGELQCLDERGGRVVVNFGDLKALVEDNDDSSEGGGVIFVVSRLSQLVELHGERLWLMGAAGSSETYSKFLRKFPSIEKDWDLKLLPIWVQRWSGCALWCWVAGDCCGWREMVLGCSCWVRRWRLERQR
uniref:SMAX1-like nucleotide binding domain-containing protein n=1 Tax=Quercus lobata TaxID=97700 RepID=A0A7N2L3P7_QUELO